MNNTTVLGIVSYKVFPAQMGGQKGIADFYTAMARKTKVVLAVAKDNELPDHPPGRVIPMLFNHWRGILNIFYIPKLITIIRKENISVVLIEHSYFGWMGWLLRLFTRIPFVIHSHNIETNRFKAIQRRGWNLYGVYEKWGHRKADHSFFKTAEDVNWAVKNWQLSPRKCTVIPFGTEKKFAADAEKKKKAKEFLCTQYHLNKETTLFLFTGSLDYPPNKEALSVITDQLVPLLQNQHFDFTILICGSGLPKTPTPTASLMYAGFVPDITPYLLGADCLIAPILSGGGIKVKVIEALAHNLRVVATSAAATGINPAFPGNKLTVIADNDWAAFAGEMSKSQNLTGSDIPADFYAHFNWDGIIQKALLSLQPLCVM